MHKADRTRNVALVGHRGSGKTSLNEALLYQAGALSRLGDVTDGTTASDTDPDEVGTIRLWERAAELDLARMVFVNMLDRERADFFRTLDSLKSAFGAHVVATEIPLGAEHEIRGVIDLVDM